MERYRAGDNAAFAELYAELAGRFHAYLRRRMRDAAAAEDLVQQTFFRMHCARETFVSGRSVEGWAFAILGRLFIDKTRRDRREARILDDAELGLDGGVSCDRTDEIVEVRRLEERALRTLERLPPAQRIAFLLVRCGGMPVAEAAKLLETTVSAVKCRVLRASDELRRELLSPEAA